MDEEDYSEGEYLYNQWLVENLDRKDDDDE